MSACFIGPTPLRPDVNAPFGCNDRKGNGVRRSQTLSLKKLTRVEMVAGIELGDVDTLTRPRTRADCLHTSRPCLFVNCRHHLYLDVNADVGSIKLNHPSLEPGDLQHSCALDVADLGGVTLEQCATVLNLTRERVRQIEVIALEKLGLTEFADEAAG